MENEVKMRKEGRRHSNSTGVQEGKVDMQAVMDVYKKLGSPGAPHGMLASMAGSWNTKIHEDVRNN